MNNPTIALISQTILHGFENWFAQFHVFTLGARQRFIDSDWKSCQSASRDRINLYLDKILWVKTQVSDIAPDIIQDPATWEAAKQEYSVLIRDLSNFEIAETFFNSIYCKFFDHEQISDKYMYVLPSADQSSRIIGVDRSAFNYYHSGGNLSDMLGGIMADCNLGLPWEDAQRDIQNMRNVILKELPADIIRNTDAYAVIHKSVFYRSKAAYLMGKVVSEELSVPFVIPIAQNESRQLYVDTLIFDPDEVSVIFSFTRAYFKVDALIPSEIVRFLNDLMPLKSTSELYNSIGYNRHGKTEFYREFLKHIDSSDDQFVIAPGIKGMVMSVFTLPSYDRVFKIIKDRFTPPKEMTRQVVKAKYTLVSRHERAGRMADTQEYSNFIFPRHRFSEELIEELLKVAPSTVQVGEEEILIKHLYVERRMIPLNIYFETATEKELHAAIEDYGNAIKQLAAANIFPGDMLFKNFGVTRHNRVVFYDYDEICPLTDCNFRRIPSPRTPEDEMASEPWYSVGPNDIFPEEFRTFLLANPVVRKIFEEHHRDIFDADYWIGLQDALNQGMVVDVIPYHAKKRFCYKSLTTAE